MVRCDAAAVAALWVAFAAAAACQTEKERDVTTTANDKKDISAMVQTVLDAPPLQKYLHPDAPGRKPLTVVTAHALTGLTKFGLPVAVAAKAGPNQPALEFTRLEIKGTRGKVAFEYAVEGLAGSFDLTRGASGSWSVDKHELHER